MRIALEVITEFEKMMVSGKLTFNRKGEQVLPKELAAAVIYRLMPLIGELAAEYELKYDCPVIDDSIVELAEKAGWA